MLKIAVVEDQPSYSQVIQGYISRYQSETGLSACVTSFPDGTSLLRNFRMEWDIIFLDIEMPGMDGISVAKEIRQKDTRVVLLFITNLAQYAIRGYEVDALDYVLKPVSYHQFFMKMQKAVKTARLHIRESVLLSGKGKEVRLPVSDILYAEVKNHHLYVVCTDDTYTLYGSMNEFEQQLPPGMFARCSQSFLVNLRYIRQIGQSEVTVEHHTLPISRSKRKDFLCAASDYFGGALR